MLHCVLFQKYTIRTIAQVEYGVVSTSLGETYICTYSHIYIQCQTLWLDYYCRHNVYANYYCRHTQLSISHCRFLAVAVEGSKKSPELIQLLDMHTHFAAGTPGRRVCSHIMYRNLSKIRPRVMNLSGS